MKEIAEFTIIGLPNLPNKDRYSHWATKSKNNKTWKLKIFHMCNDLKISGLELKSAKLTFIRHSTKEPDYDNLCASFKACQDGLVSSRVIIDDKTAVIGIPTYQWIYRQRKLGGQITVRIEA